MTWQVDEVMFGHPGTFLPSPGVKLYDLHPDDPDADEITLPAEIEPGLYWIKWKVWAS